jgi:hypothetical protein
MIFIAHRGNINGRKPKLENGDRYCQEAIDEGYNIEIDVHWYEGIFWTGHDRPQYRVNTEFLKKKEVWCHAKDIQSLYQLQEIEAHCFFHQKDDVTLTSKGYLWTYPTYPLTKKSICVLPEIQKVDYNKCAGICSDYIAKEKESWTFKNY